MVWWIRDVMKTLGGLEVLGNTYNGPYNNSLLIILVVLEHGYVVYIPDYSRIIHLYEIHTLGHGSHFHYAKYIEDLL